jgi:hypothetical protein
MAEEGKTYEFDDLKHMKVDALREIAAGIEGFTGYTQMNKDHLLQAICEQLNIDMFIHHHVVGIDKAAIKGQIKELKMKRDAALEAHDSAELKKVRRQIHHLKRRLHKATV